MLAFQTSRTLSVPARRVQPFLRRPQSRASPTVGAAGWKRSRVAIYPCCLAARSHQSVALRVSTRYFTSGALSVSRQTSAPRSPITATAVGSASSPVHNEQQPSAASSSSSPSQRAAPPSKPQDGATDLPVSPVLIAELKTIMQRQQPMTWLHVSNLYADLPPRLRREHVRPHKSMLHVLQKTKRELGITLNPTGVFYALGDMPVSVAEESTPRPQASRKQTENSQNSRTTGKGEEKVSSSSPAAVADELKVVGFTAVDFFYDVQLRAYPPPPPDFDVNAATLQRDVSRSSADGTVIAMKDFVAYIPTFFTPVPEILSRMPGYTEDHLRQFFHASVMEVVTLEGQSYMRLYGGYEKLSLDGCEAAEEVFDRYRPRPTLAEHFVEAFRGAVEKWVPLSTLLARADPAIVAQLPYKGPAAVMYFAQMQHKFAFAVRQVPSERAGAAATTTTTEAAVLLRRPDFCGLDSATSPTPRVLSFAFAHIPFSGPVEVAEVERQLPADLQKEAEDYYGSFAQFLRMHAPIFYLPPENPSIVMRLRYRQRFLVSTLSLEEQVEIAKKEGKKGKMRVLRRRIAFRDNPSHPFLDPENLAKELATHLPRRGFVTMKKFLKLSIPEELLLFLPPKVHNFFKSYPQYFTQFEYQKAGTWALCRPDQPLPRGVIRQNFSESDLVRIIAEFLQKRGPRSLSTVVLNIPRGAQEIVKKRYGNLYSFVRRYPQYFHVVLSSDNENAQSSAMLHLTQAPSTELYSTALAASAGSASNPHAPSDALGSDDGRIEDDDDDDYDGLD